MKYLDLIPVPVAIDRKTRVWRVVAKDGGSQLGHISWHAPWRRYCFFPLGNTIFEPTCLRDLATACEEKTNERKAERVTPKPEAAASQEWGGK